MPLIYFGTVLHTVSGFFIQIKADIAITYRLTLR